MKREKLAAAFFATVMVLGLAASAGAVDGVIEINQAKVLASAGGFPYGLASGSYRLTGNLTVAASTTVLLRFDQWLRGECTERQRLENQRGHFARPESLQWIRLLRLWRAVNSLGYDPRRRGHLRCYVASVLAILGAAILISVASAAPQTPLSFVCVSPDITVALTSATVSPQQVQCYLFPSGSAPISFHS